MQPMGIRLGVDHQQLQQFVSSSTWDYAVRGRLARWAETFIRPRAFVVDDTGFPKDGSDSPGVARMYSGSLGKVGNCQIGVSVHAVTDWASAAIDWRLFLPRSWDDTATGHATEHAEDPDVIAQIRARRTRSKIPDQVRHQEKWRQALDIALRVRPANRAIPRGGDGSLPQCWLIAEWPAGAAEPTDYWLSNLPVDTGLRELVGLAKIRWRIEHDYRELKDGLGLDHFEGRSYPGWHRHNTLVALAQAFCTSLRYDPKAPAPA
jgi:SRSO17 transposase